METFEKIIEKGENDGNQHFLLYPQCVFYPITRQQILDWSKLKQSADDNFKFDENTRKLSKRVENTG